MSAFKNWMKVLRIIYTVGACISAIIILTFSILLYSEFNSINDEYELLIENWQKDPINEIQLVNSQNSCPSGYDDDFIFYKPSSTQSGCLCINGIISKKQCCTNTDDSSDCECHGTEIDAVSQSDIDPFRNWNNFDDDEEDSFKMCVKRITGYRFIDYAPLSEDFECQEDEKLCGNNYCVPEDEKCPITSFGVGTSLPNILLSSYGSVSADTNKDDGGFGDLHDDEDEGGYIRIYMTTLLQIGSSKLIYWRREEDDKLPVVEAKADQGNGICIKSTDNNYSSNDDKYPLNDDNKCDEIDERYFGIDMTVSERTFFKINQKSPLKDLPYFDDYLNSGVEYKIYYRNNVQLGYECRDDMDLFVSNESDLDSVEKSLLALMIICIIFSFVILVFEWWSIWLDGDKTEFYGPVICLKDDRKNCFVVFVAIVKIISIVMMFFAIIFTMSYFYLQKSFVNSVLSADCLDGETQDLFETIDETLSGGYLNAIVAIFLFYFIFEPNFCYNWLKLCKKCCKCFGCVDEKKKDKYKKKQKKDKKKKRKDSSSSSSSSSSDKSKKKNKKNKNDNTPIPLINYAQPQQQPQYPQQQPQYPQQQPQYPQQQPQYPQQQPQYPQQQPHYPQQQPQYPQQQPQYPQQQPQNPLQQPQYPQQQPQFQYPQQQQPQYPQNQPYPQQY